MTLNQHTSPPSLFGNYPLSGNRVLVEFLLRRMAAISYPEIFPSHYNQTPGIETNPLPLPCARVHAPLHASA